MKNGFKTLIVAAAATAAAITYIKKLDSESTESNVVKINKDADENQPKGKITTPVTSDIKTTISEAIDKAEEVTTQVKEDVKEFVNTLSDSFTQDQEEQETVEEEESTIDPISTIKNIFEDQPIQMEETEDQPVGLESFIYSQFAQNNKEATAGIADLPIQHEENLDDDDEEDYMGEEDFVDEDEFTDEVILENEENNEEESKQEEMDNSEQEEEVEETEEEFEEESEELEQETEEETIEAEESKEETEEATEEIIEVEEPEQEIVEEEPIEEVVEEQDDAEEMIENSFAQKEIAKQEGFNEENEQEPMNEEISEEEPVVEERDSDDAELVEPEHEEEPTFDQPIIEELKVEYDGSIPMIKSMTDAELVEKFTADYPVLTENKVLSIIKQLKLMYETVDPNADCVRLQHYIAFNDEETRETFAIDAAEKGFNVEKENNNFNLYISNVIDNNFDDITVMIMQLAAASIDYSGKYKGWALR